MKLLNSFSEYVIEYESEREYELNRCEYTLSGYRIVKVDKKSKEQIVVTYQKNEYE